jgi:hypothetical protein
MTDTEKAEYDDVVRMLTVKLEQLVAENARLRSEKSDAMSVVKEIYSDPSASPALRLKAAGLALPHETPRLTPVPPAIDATCEDIEPLHQLVERQRARAARIRALPLSVREAMVRGVAPDITLDGNGNVGDTGS